MDPQPDSMGLPPDTEQIFEVQPEPQGNSDEELAGLMADPEVVENVEQGDSAGAVEASAAPAAANENEEEEQFSMDDFEEGFVDGQNGEDESSQDTTASDPAYAIPSAESLPEPDNEPSGDGVVAGFRRALAGLAAQAELDRIAHLRDTLAQRGDPVPELDEIAADVTGEKLISPEGDCDLYGRRPAARLEGWKVGLAFGSPRRAKRYNKS